MLTDNLVVLDLASFLHIVRNICLSTVMIIDKLVHM